MNENNDRKTLTTLILGVIIGSLVVFFTLGGFSNDTKNLKEEVTNLSENIEYLEDFIILHASCELGDKVACDNVSKEIQSNELFNKL